MNPSASNVYSTAPRRSRIPPAAYSAVSVHPPGRRRDVRSLILAWAKEHRDAVLAEFCPELVFTAAEEEATAELRRLAGEAVEPLIRDCKGSDKYTLADLLRWVDDWARQRRAEEAKWANSWRPKG